MFERVRRSAFVPPHAHSRAQGEEEEEGEEGEDDDDEEDSDDPDLKESEDEKSNAAARGSRLAAAATGVQITPYVAAYGMRAGMSFMLRNVAAEPMIVQMLITELAKKLSQRSFFPCHSRGRRRARTTHAGTRSHCTVARPHTPTQMLARAHTHTPARTLK